VKEISMRGVEKKGGYFIRKGSIAKCECTGKYS
jgi:hypothetical protein